MASLGQTVTVTAGGTANVQLNVVHATGEEPQFIGVDQLFGVD
jgi:basic membrane lipoprotein Med (substrate-binding protein (PBP1-ABC) superfamily)